MPQGCNVDICVKQLKRIPCCNVYSSLLTTEKTSGTSSDGDICAVNVSGQLG